MFFEKLTSKECEGIKKQIGKTDKLILIKYISKQQ